MNTSIQYILAWALFEEVIKAAGVKISIGTKYLLVGLLWFFIIEILMKTDNLTRDFQFSDRDSIKVYSAAALMSSSSSIIHIYTNILYMKTNKIIFAVVFCTILHSIFNFLAENIFSRIFTDHLYIGVLTTSFIMSSVFGMLVFLYYNVEKRVLAEKMS